MTKRGDLATVRPAELAAPARAVDNPGLVYLAGLGPRSRKTQQGALRVLAEVIAGEGADPLSVQWSALRFQHTTLIRQSLAEKYPPATANRMLSALRQVLRASWRLRQMTSEQYRRAADLDNIKGDRLPAGRSLTAGEVSAIFGACAVDGTPAGVRDAALLALLRLGLRRAEVSGVQLADVTPEGVQVLGKGNKERLVPLSGGARAAIDDWLVLRGDAPGPLLYQVNKAGRIVPRGISGQSVYDVLKRRAAEARVSDVTPHDWRRSFVSDLLDAGADLSIVQKLAGHSSPETTARYDRRGAEARRRAVDALHVPYVRRPLDGV